MRARSARILNPSPACGRGWPEGPGEGTAVMNQKHDFQPETRSAPIHEPLVSEKEAGRTGRPDLRPISVGAHGVRPQCLKSLVFGTRNDAETTGRFSSRTGPGARRAPLREWLLLFSLLPPRPLPALRATLSRTRERGSGRLKTRLRSIKRPCRTSMSDLALDPAPGWGGKSFGIDSRRSLSPAPLPHAGEGNALYMPWRYKYINKQALSRESKRL